ncbi:MAG: TorF family putative porin [Burkholderiaceae bacterium]|nr:TorF family putative porin [Burkholderiaceae bacterium]
MNKYHLILAAVIAMTSASNQAQESKPDNEWSGNAALVSDYSYRGISQTRLQPALQGGADYINNPTGLYAGTWLSTIKWITDQGGSGSVEWDLYAGRRGDLTADVAYDVGVLSYVYAGNALNPNANTTELYGQLSYKAIYAKYSQSMTNLFGFADSRNSGYFDLGANWDIARQTQLNLHVGHQSVRNDSAFDYTDWKIGVTRNFEFASVGIAAVGTNSHAYVGPGPDRKDLGKSRLVLSLSKTF